SSTRRPPSRFSTPRRAARRGGGGSHRAPARRSRHSLVGLRRDPRRAVSPRCRRGRRGRGVPRGLRRPHRGDDSGDRASGGAASRQAPKPPPSGRLGACNRRRARSRPSPHRRRIMGADQRPREAHSAKIGRLRGFLDHDVSMKPPGRGVRGTVAPRDLGSKRAKPCSVRNRPKEQSERSHRLERRQRGACWSGRFSPLQKPRLRRTLSAMEVPDVQYARSGDVNIAYQVTGDGPFDLVFVPGYVTHLELHWAIPSFTPFLERLSSFSRLIRFDKRGTGMSDRVSGAPTLETRMDDVRAVMDAVGSRRAAFYGLSEGAAMSILFAATYPERTAALVVRSAFPRRMWAPDYPWGRTEEQYEREVERDLRVFGPRQQAREAIRVLGRFSDAEGESFLQMLRFGSSPGSLEALHRMNKEIDVRHVLPAVRVPTLVLHATEDTIVPIDVARYVASRIPTARLVELPGVGHLAFSSGQTAIAGEIERFVTDVWEAGGWEEAEPDRLLATVLFTDIVGSTVKATELGDRAWRELLE